MQTNELGIHIIGHHCLPAPVAILLIIDADGLESTRMAFMVLSAQLLAQSKRQSFLRAAKTMQKASADGGPGGNGVDLSKGFPDSFILAGAVAKIKATNTPLIFCPACLLTTLHVLYVRCQSPRSY